MFHYSIMLSKGDGIPVNKSESARYSKLATDLGNDEAMCILIIGDGITINKIEALRYFKMDIDKGNDNVMFSYAVMQNEVYGIPINKAEALCYFKMAADKGNINAICRYGANLYNGNGIPINKKEAVHYLKMAAEKRNVDAMYNYSKYCFGFKEIDFLVHLRNVEIITVLRTQIRVIYLILFYKKKCFVFLFINKLYALEKNIQW